MNISRKLRAVINFNLIFGLAFIIHVISIWYNLVHPEHPSVWIYKMNLRDIEFPITFDLCVQEKEEPFERFNNVGYSNKYNYFRGKSNYEKHEHFYGWSGHTETGSTLSSVQGKLFIQLSI